MPRDPHRIDSVLTAVRIYWHRHPDLRLGQIVGNMAEGDPYYIEDEDLVAKLVEAIREPRTG